MKNANFFFNKNLILFSLILLSLGLSGCATVGHVVSVDQRILIADEGKSHGSYKSGGLTLQYSYSIVGEDMTLTGNANYRGGVDSLEVRLLFLDANGTILQQKLIYYSGYRVDSSWGEDSTFQKTFAVPPGAAGISFNYLAQPRHSRK